MIFGKHSLCANCHEQMKFSKTNKTFPECRWNSEVAQEFMTKISEARRQKFISGSAPSLYFSSYFKATCSQQSHRIKKLKNRKVLRDKVILLPHLLRKQRHRAIEYPSEARTAGKHLITAHWMGDIQDLTNRIFTITLEGRYNYHPYFIDEVTGAQRGWVTWAIWFLFTASFFWIFNDPPYFHTGNTQPGRLSLVCPVQIRQNPLRTPSLMNACGKWNSFCFC